MLTPIKIGISSCLLGLYRIRVYGDDGTIHKTGTGMFARAFTEHFPRIPVEEAGRLCDPGIRENFIERLFSLQRWRNLLDTHRTLGGLVEFHTQNKLLILSHNQEIYRQMGRLVAQGKKQAPDLLFDAYEQLLLKVLVLKTTVKKNINVLQHVMGYFKRNLTGEEKQELLDIIRLKFHGHPVIIFVSPHQAMGVCDP